MEDEFKKNVRKSAKGSLTLLVSQVLSTLFLAVGMLIIARSLGSNKWGLLSVANSVVNIAQLFQNIGYQDALITYVSYYKHMNRIGDAKLFIKGGLLLSLGTTAFIIVILWGLSDYVAIQIYHEPALAYYIKLLSIALIGRALLFVSYGVTVGYERMKLRGALRVTYTLLKSIISPFLILLGYGIYGGVLGEVGPVILTGALGITIVYYPPSNKDCCCLVLPGNLWSWLLIIWRNDP